jgi:hypothetical protein
MLRESDLHDGGMGEDRPPSVAFPAPSVACTPPESGAYGRIADSGGPESRLRPRTRWSPAGGSGRSDGL